jgi:tRNA(Leu) C34 or U34 (ribose-2'-O)-methylase TrmL
MNFGADYIFTIGARYKRQRADTTKTWRNIPLFEYKDWSDFADHIPRDAELVFIEQTPDAKPLETTEHPKRALYILGAEDHGIPLELMRGHRKMQIDTPMCLNVAVAGSIVMYDRHTKGRQAS